MNALFMNISYNHQNTICIGLQICPIFQTIPKFKTTHNLRDERSSIIQFFIDNNMTILRTKAGRPDLFR